MADQQVQGMLVQIEATTAQLRRELANADQLVARSSQAIDQSLAKVDSAFDRAGAAAQQAGTLVRGAFAAVAGAGLIGGIIQQVDAYGQMSDRMKAAAGSAGEYQLVQEHLLQTAQETYRPLAEAQELYIRTADVMRSLGFNTQQTLDITDSFSFLLVTNAAAADKAGSALDAYSKALQTGKVEADGWVSIQDAMPTIVTAIATATGKSAEEIRKLGVEGKLSLDYINTGLLSNVEVNRKAAAEMSTSVQDAMVNISNAIQVFVGGMEEQTGIVAGFASVLIALADNVDLVAVAMGGVGAAALTNYVAKTGLAVQAARADRVARIAQAEATLQAAIADQRKAQTATILAEREAIAARGTAVQTQMSLQLATARTKEAAATTAVATAQSGLKAASAGLLAGLGGPMGLAILAGTAAASFLLLRDNADKAGVSLEDMQKPVSQLREEFQKLNRDQRAAALVDWKQRQVKAAEEVQDAYGSLAQSIRRATVTAPARDSGGMYGKQLTEYQSVIDRLNEARKAGDGLSPILQEVGERLKVPEGTLQQWITQARAVGNADETSSRIADTLRVLTGATNDNTASTQANNAAKLGMSTAGQTYLDTLQKQLAGLQDNGDMIKVVNRYLAEHTDLTEADRLAALSFANAIEAQKKANERANKSKRDGESKSDQATKKQLKDFDTTEEGYKRQIELINTTGDKQKDATEVAKLSFELQEGKLGNLSKAQQKRLLELAAELDGLNKIKKANEDALKLSAFKATQEAGTKTQADGFAQELSGVGSGDKARDRMRAELALRQKYVADLKALNEQANTGQVSPELVAGETKILKQELDKQLENQANYYAAIDEQQSNWMNGVHEAWANFADDAQNYSAQAADATTNILGSARSELSTFMTDVATETESAGDALGNMIGGFAESVLNALADMAAQWLIYQGVQLLVGKTTQASAAGMMAANAQATALQAGLAAFASTAAIPIVGPALAPGAMATALTIANPLASAVGMTAMSGVGFMDGGYTGHGRKDEVAGPVHRGEYVFDAEATARIGVGTLEAISDGRAAFIGGPGSSSAPTADSSASGGTAPAQSAPQVNLYEDASRAGQVQMSTGPDGRQIIDLCVANIRQGGALAKAHEQYYGAKRIGR
ncbi:phage tail tape measure protein [Pseudomonas sp. CM25]|uniref:phage tail tape measure protein n=1 Tax=unclassified Pseudomonas TaxID=196821 RepID=UPI000D737C55|nr:MULTISPECIES: phage tail tape measure protein [unclassified Pseudomonas]NQD54025.1 phage tail tape measure protein [Pseudomonas sp. CM25]PWY39073.1 phage tail tape measure protein [Pseudomonas sp. RW405]